MANISTFDESRTEKLRQWLEAKGVDVVQVGDDLAMPSPFKEKEKRRTEGSGYTDTKRRLWAKVILGRDGKPNIVWQCWWSKSKAGKGLGGYGSYAVALAAKVKKEEINELLGLEYDEAVQKAEGQDDKAIALLFQSIREESERSIISKESQKKSVVAAKIPREVPSGIIRMWAGSFMTLRGEEMVSARGITKELGSMYGLAWDMDKMSIMFPWLDAKGDFQLAQWWDGEKYRFDQKDGTHFTKEDGIFGLHLYRKERLILCEGVFTAMSLTAQALGGSTLTDAQMAILLSLSPKEIILALDNDNGGMFGTQAIYKALRSLLPDAAIEITMPPMGFNDWNDVLKSMGVVPTLTEFAKRVQYSRDVGAMTALALSFSPIKGSR